MGLRDKSRDRTNDDLQSEGQSGPERKVLKRKVCIFTRGEEGNWRKDGENAVGRVSSRLFSPHPGRNPAEKNEKPEAG